MTSWVSPYPDEFDGPTAGPDQRAVLAGYLAFQRRTLLAICAGLTTEQLALRPSPPSGLSLLGLLRHLAKVERIWWGERVSDPPRPPLYAAELGFAHDFDATEGDTGEAAVARLRAEWAAADVIAAEHNLDDEFGFTSRADPTTRHVWSVRFLYQHLIGEYARHNGHADLLREQLDGVTDR